MYRPDIARYQQLGEPITGRFDCGAYMAACAADADTAGKVKLTGRQVRLATDEPIPDRNSPGLNLRQTDDAVVLLTKGDVNLDTQWAAPWSRVESKLKEGRWGHLCVMRGPLVDAGFSGGDRFRGRHGILIGYDPAEKTLLPGHSLGTPIMGDPLVPYWQNVTWAALKRAAGDFTPEVGFGAADVAFTRVPGVQPPQPRYSVRFPGAMSFFAYRVNAWTLKVIDREAKRFSAKTSAPCSGPARAYNWPGHGNRRLVMVTDGSLKGLYCEPGASGITLVVTK